MVEVLYKGSFGTDVTCNHIAAWQTLTALPYLPVVCTSSNSSSDVPSFAQSHQPAPAALSA